MPDTVTLHDTLSRGTRPLEARDGRAIRCYCCGPTVYGPAHIGNFRTFLLQDVLRRVLQAAGHEVRHVRNITDVDDKTIREAREAGQSLVAFTQGWTERFHADCAALNMLAPDEEPRATAHIPQMVAMIEHLVANGHAYLGGDGSVYFRIASKPDYGKLSHLDREALQTQATNSAGQANNADEYDRESVADFALWKAAKPEDGDNRWPSPWGEGRPGWHIECSAMSIHYLGETLDLHGGGVDLCFPHHENEVAQSECATGHAPFARHWFHSAHLLVEGKKMSKSLGNFWTLDDVRQMGYSAMDLRYALISAHYRQQLNLTGHSLQAARSALGKLRKAVLVLQQRAGMPEAGSETDALRVTLAEGSVFTAAWTSLREDLNTPAALGGLFSGLKALDAITDAGRLRAEFQALLALLAALGLDPFADEEAETAPTEIPREIQDLAEQRWQAKKDKDFAKADALRDELHNKGWNVLDRKDSYELEKI